VAKKKAKQRMEGEEIDLGWVGEIEEINAEIINITAEQGYIPVISPIAVDREGNSLNVNADSVAAEIACVIKAEKLILLTDVVGLLRNPADPSTLISQATPELVNELVAEGVIGGGMIPKVEACLKAAYYGVTAHIIDGKVPHTILLELLTDKGIGTMIKV